MIVTGATGLGLLACGGASHTSKQVGATTARSTGASQNAQGVAQNGTGVLAFPSDSPSAVLAHVGGKAITVGAVEHRMALLSAGSPLPDPPGFSGCVARRKAGPAAGQSEAQLKVSCQLEYEKSAQAALSSAIHTEWLIGEAGEEGIKVSPAEVLEEFNASKKQFRTEAEFSAYRKSSGQSVADMMSEIRLGKLSDRIFQNIKKKEHPASSAEVSAYYNSHRLKFAIPEGRNLRVLRATTEVAALKAKREVQSGTSFALAAKKLYPVAQPAKHGEVQDLLPHTFDEKPLKETIFQAQLHRLYGPVKVTNGHPIFAPETNNGYFLFEVTAKVPASQKSLAQVKDTIAQELSKAKESQTLAASIAAIKSRWRAKTECRAGYIVENCRQYKASSGKAIPGDPYTL